MFESSNSQPRNRLTDWVLRAAIALAFLLFGLDKFPSNPDGEWVRFFAQIGVGQWFRWFTGSVELLGAALVLLPATVIFGLGLLAITMAGAVLVHIAVMHRPFDAVIPGAILLGLLAFYRSRRNQQSTLEEDRANLTGA